MVIKSLLIHDSTVNCGRSTHLKQLYFYNRLLSFEPRQIMNQIYCVLFVLFTEMNSICADEKIARKPKH